MYRRLFRASVLAAVLATAMGCASAATLPSHLMLPDPALANQGVTERWVLAIRLESTDLKGMEPCRAVLQTQGFAPVLSKTATSAMPELHFKIEGSKEYAQAGSEPDEVLAAVQQARCTGTLNWTVTSKPVQK
ncbi:MAG: hypothetical protein ABW202_21630 [Duganella sp.]